MRLQCWTQLLRSLILGWLLTTLLCELNCARSGTKFLIAHVLVVVVGKWAWYTMTCYLSEGMMLARKNPLNTLNGPSHHLPSIFVLSFFIVHRIQLIRVSTTAFFNEFSTYIETILLSKEHCWWRKYPRRCLPRSSLSQTTRSFKVCQPPAIHHRAYANSGSHTWSRYTMLSNSAIRRLSRKTPMTPGFSFDL